MPDEDKTFSGSFVLDLRIWWRQAHTLYKYCRQYEHPSKNLSYGPGFPSRIFQAGFPAE